MKETLLKLIVLTCSILFVNTVFSQSDNWEEYYSDNQIKIEYTYQNCEYTEQFNSEYVVFKITNTTNQNITVKWQEQLWIDDNCINCELNSPEFRKEIKISANHITSGDCKTSNNLRIFSKFTERLEDMPGVNKIVSLSKFELKNLTITYND